MLVGEVRWATTGCGSSWKLSGGRKLSSGSTKRLEEAPGAAGEEPQGLRLGSGVKGSAAAADGGQADPPRDRRARATQSSSSGPAHGQTPPAPERAAAATATAVSAASASPPDIRR